jgi:SOS-response transcriptional repressor LexA
MNDINQRIAKKREEAGLNQSELARALGVSPQAVQNWESGDNIPRSTRLADIAKAINTTVEYLMFGTITNTQPFISEPKAKYFVGIPIISWDESAQWDTLSSTWEPSESTEFLSCPKSIGCAFALEVCGIAMEPRFTEGDIIFVDPKLPPRNKKFVLALPNGQDVPILRQYLEEGGKSFLCALNTGAPVERFTPIDESTKICGVVIGKWRDE